MKSPLFSQREILTFLLDHADSIDARSESECWRVAWQSFSRGVFDQCHHDGPQLHFENVCRFYGYSPAADESGTYRLKHYDFESDFAT